jgi:GNAT superfamily N-acetyltransferase
MNVVYRELEPVLWPALETLFGKNGACGGCWCQWWRVERGGKLWNETKGEPAKTRMREMTQTGKAMGILAFDDHRPVGWCSFGPRADFPRIERIKAYKRSDVEGIWSVTCFFIAKDYRGKGLAWGLLLEALKAMKKRGVETVEAYPVTLTADGTHLADSFSWTGPITIFEKAGFKTVQQTVASKPLLQLAFF